MARRLATSGCCHTSAAAAAAAAHSAASSSRLLGTPRVWHKHADAARTQQHGVYLSALAGSSGALQDERQEQLQLNVALLPRLGGGRVPRSAQLQQQELARTKNAGSKRRATVNVAKLLTNQIAAASSLDQLHDIVAGHGSNLDHIHVAKLLARTAQLASAAPQQQQLQALDLSVEWLPKQQQQQQQQQQGGDQPVQLQHLQKQQQLQLLCTSLTAMMVQRLRHSTAQSFVPALAALGRLATLRLSPSGSSSSSCSVAKPTQQQLEQLAVRASELAPALSISQLTVVLWGLAKAGIKSSSSKPSSRLEPLLEAFLAQYQTTHELHEQQQHRQQQQQQQQQQQPVSGPPLQRPALPGKQQQQQQQQRWPELQQVQQQLLQEPSLQQQQQQVVQQHSLATDLALVLYALAVMGCQPEAAWLGRWQAAVLQQLPEANAQDVSQMLWAMSSLGVRPEVSWLQQLLSATQPLLDSAGSQSLSSMVWAVSRLTPQPPQLWLQAFLQALQEDATLAASPQAFSTCVAALAKLNAPVDRSWLSTFLEITAQQLPMYTPWQLTNTAWACASLNAKPSAVWMRGFLKAFAELADAGSFGVNQLASVLWSLAVLGRSSEPLPMSQQLQVLVGLQALAAASNGAGLKQLGPAGRSALAWSLASLNVMPSKQWLSQYLSAAFDGGLASDQLRCANVLFCIASVDFEYLVEWLGDFLQGGADSSGASGGLDLSLAKYAALADVLAALGEMDSRQLRAAWLDASGAEWSLDAAAGDGALGFSLQLPPGLSAWVDSMLTPSTAAAETAAMQTPAAAPSCD